MATLHRLGKPDLAMLESQLLRFSKEKPVALVLPCHAKELGTPALKKIIETLSKVNYLSQIVVGIDGADADDWQRAKTIFTDLPQKPALLWNDGPRMKNFMKHLARNDCFTGPPGKGRNLWLCFGYVMACDRAQMLVVHDCDILTYSRELLARLVYPVAHPTLGFDFCKGYSARFSDKLNGRVMRLMLTPLLRSLESIVGSHYFLLCLDTFRYPLAGEISVNMDTIRRCRIPFDWGIEVGVLAEIFRVASPKSICQVDLCERYDHKHQTLDIQNPKKGLSKMATDIANSIFHTLASHGIKLDKGIFDTLLSTYTRKAEDTMHFYAADAEINGLSYDRHEEEMAVKAFSHSIQLAGEAFLADPQEAPMIPNWNRVKSMIPNVMKDFFNIVAADNV
ncbi:MAG: glycosyl transferase [Chthoniobacterales bacterium]